MQKAADATNDRIWKGDPKAVAEQRERRRRGELSLTEWASTLYSYQHISQYECDLINIAWELEYETKPEEAPAFASGLTAEKAADRADVLSTILLALSHDRAFCKESKELLHAAAARALRFGLRQTEHEPHGEHTRALLQLTEFDLFPGRKYLLDEVAVRARHIRDTNQRERVYRKLGVLARLTGHIIRGTLLGIRAVGARGVSWNSRKKAIAAFLPEHWVSVLLERKT